MPLCGFKSRRFEEYRNRDKRKDAKLKEEGWQILRITWKNILSNKDFYIKLAKDFIEL